MSPSLPFLPDVLIAEILSFLDVKSILQFKCVCKFWNTLFSDPIFLKLHLKKSAKQNPHLLIITEHETDILGESFDGSDDTYVLEDGVIPYSVTSLLDNPSFNLSVDSYYLVQDKGCSNIVGSCNGLICLVDRSMFDEYYEYSFRLWNPATRMTSPKLGFLRLFCNSSVFPSSCDGCYCFNFGYDNSTDTYKAVASRYNRRELRSNVRILSMRYNVWRDIESFQVIPLNLDLFIDNTAVYFNNSINWLAIQNHFWYKSDDISVEQFVIVSLDLRTETYNQYLLPSGFDEVPLNEPTVGVLKDCLCFSYCYKETHFLIWQMNKFGIQDSWSQFLKISYHNLQINNNNESMYIFNIVPLFLFEDGDTLILRCHRRDKSQDIIYNWRNNKVERINIIARKTITDDRTVNSALCATDNYFESLVSVF